VGVCVSLVRRLRRRLSTPELYRVVAAGLVLLGLGTGVAALGTERHRAGLIADVGSVSGPLSMGAQDLYRSLSDADATAATAFLANGVEPAGLRQRYLDDVARATTALTVALRDAGDEDATLLSVLADQLPVYTGLVETARSYNRLGVPLGGAYLREASGMMRQTLLPAAQQLFDSAQRRLIDAQRDAAGFPWMVLLLGLVTVGCLVAAQVLLRRRTNRVFNVGLVAASAAAVLLVTWSSLALAAAGGRVQAGHRDGSAQVSVLADARRAALQARADEALTLIARGSGGAFEKDFAAGLGTLIGPDGAGGGLLDKALAQAPTAGDRAVIAEARDHARQWRELHTRVRALDDGGDYDKAVALATGSGADSPATAFGRLDTAMGTALAASNDRVDRQATHAGTALAGLWVALVLLTAGLVAAVVLGFRPRIGEYR
jgi:hypothetical protein